MDRSPTQTQKIRKRGRKKKPYLGDNKHLIQIDKNCDMKGAALDRNE